MIRVKNKIKIAILGDSISTQKNRNVTEIKIEKEDVGKELCAYPTYYDIGTTIGGYILDASNVGKELKFIPSNGDIGKEIGTSLNYNESVEKVWWEYVEEYFDAEMIPVCWSGSSFTRHEENILEVKTSYAWHDSQIRKLGTRVKGGMDRVAPDIVIIYRGCNDMTHMPFSKIIDNDFDRCDWKYPDTDMVGDDYCIVRAISLTIEKIRKTYPDTKVVLATQTTFKRINCDSFPSNNGFYNLPYLNKTIREIADFFGCYTIDFDKCNITYENCYNLGYITDDFNHPTHPNSKGHEKMGKQAIYDLLYKLRIK